LVLCGAEIVINPADEKPCSAAAEEVLWECVEAVYYFHGADLSTAGATSLWLQQPNPAPAR
jgi:hypothetical protein